MQVFGRWVAIIVRRRVSQMLSGPQALAFFPAISTAAYLFAGEKGLITTACLAPLLYIAASGGQSGRTNPKTIHRILQKADFNQIVEQSFRTIRLRGQRSAAFSIAIDEFDELLVRHGSAAAETVVQCVGERLVSVFRDNDIIGQMADARFAVAAAGTRHLDLELCIQISGRIQNAIEQPILVDGMSIYVTASVGFCLHARAPGGTGRAWLAASVTALREARRQGPSTIRAYSREMHKETTSRTQLREEVAEALNAGHIQPWFQPQISTDTGKITGFEALARWDHPQRGLLQPGEFLPAVEEAGLIERLTEVMMYNAFTALKTWDAERVDIPKVGVNFSGTELKNPKLSEKIKWELDRFELRPNRLSIEVLETVVANGADDVITRNIVTLGKMGCQIDLDDFGTGHASITSIARFSVGRIKIDRSFVSRSDRDPEQQKMIAAIITMAERLGVETLAEGIETVGEHVLLAQLGCNHVQGYGIARPMPFSKTLAWIAKHNAKLLDMPRISNKGMS